MDLQDLTDVHSGRNAQRVQHDIQRTSVRQERHILHRKDAGYAALVSVTSGHLIADGDFSLLGNVDADRLVHARRQLVAVLSGKYLRCHDDTVSTVGNLQARVADLSRLLTEDGAEQSLLGSQLGLTLRGNLSYQDITGTDLRTDADDASLIQVFQRIIADARNIAGDLLRSQLGVAGLCLVLFNMNGCVYVILYQTLADKNGVLVVVAFPGHET